MESKRPTGGPTLVKVEQSGLALDFAIQKRKISGLSMDFSEGSGSNGAGETLGLLNKVVTGIARRKGGPLPYVVKAVSSQGHGSERPSAGSGTRFNAKGPGLRLEMALHQRGITKLSIDYQRVAGEGEIRELIRELGRVRPVKVEAPQVVVPRAPVKRLKKEPEQRPPARAEQMAPHPPRPWKVLGTEDSIIVEAVKESLKMIGENGRDILVSLIENRYGMGYEDIPDHPRGFIGILRETLGSTADTVEREIVRQIKGVFPAQGSSFQEVVFEVKSGMKVKPESPAAEVTAIVPLSPVQIMPVLSAQAEPVQGEAMEPIPVVVGGAAPEEMAATAPVAETRPRQKALEEIPTVSLNFNRPAEPTNDEFGAMDTAVSLLAKPKRESRRSWFKRRK